MKLEYGDKLLHVKDLLLIISTQSIIVISVIQCAVIDIVTCLQGGDNLRRHIYTEPHSKAEQRPVEGYRGSRNALMSGDDRRVPRTGVTIVEGVEQTAGAMMLGKEQG